MAVEALDVQTAEGSHGGRVEKSQRGGRILAGGNQDG